MKITPAVLAEIKRNLEYADEQINDLKRVQSLHTIMFIGVLLILMLITFTY